MMSPARRYGTVVLWLFAMTLGCDKTEASPVNVFVSILPQKYFVEQVGGPYVNVSVMVRPGQNPATYEPLPKQMMALAQTDLYFRVGVPFEKTWMPKIQAVNKGLLVVDTREGIPLRDMERPIVSGKHFAHFEHHHHGKDPHIWLSPRLVKQQVMTIARALQTKDPEHANDYEKRAEHFCQILDGLSQDIEDLLRDIPYRRIMVFHPAWGYFADEFRLEQMPIESEGKEPSPKELEHMVRRARESHVRAIFVQAQFSTQLARTVADILGVPVVSLDPLAEDYVDNMRRIAEAIKQGLVTHDGS